MNPTPASVAALVLVVAALSLIVLAATAVSPRVDRVPQIELGRIERAQRPAQREHPRSTEPRSTPVPARTPDRAKAPAPARTPVPTPAEAPVAPPEATVAEPPATEGAAVAPEAPQPEAGVAPAAPPPADVVAAYYRALDARRFQGAWDLLSPTVHEAFGGFEQWRAGFATTVASRPQGIAVERDGSVATVAHELVTEDHSPCGPVRRRFAVRWRLVLGAEGWRAASLTGVKRSGPEPAAACPAGHDAAGDGGDS